MSVKNKKYRIRDRSIHIMVTDYEYEIIKSKMKEAGKRTLREYIIDSAVNGYIINVDYSELNNLIYEVNKIGTNINQIAYRVNSTNSVSDVDMDELTDKLNMIWQLLRSKLFMYK